MPSKKCTRKVGSNPSPSALHNSEHTSKRIRYSVVVSFVAFLFWNRRIFPRIEERCTPLLMVFSATVARGTIQFSLSSEPAKSMAESAEHYQYAPMYVLSGCASIEEHYFPSRQDLASNRTPFHVDSAAKKKKNLSVTRMQQSRRCIAISQHETIQRTFLRKLRLPHHRI